MDHSYPQLLLENDSRSPLFNRGLLGGDDAASMSLFQCPTKRCHPLDEREADLCRREVAVAKMQERLSMCHDAMRMWEVQVLEREQELKRRESIFLDMRMEMEARSASDHNSREEGHDGPAGPACGADHVPADAVLETAAADQAFQREQALLSEPFRGICVAVQHVGSTAVPDALSRPYLDVLFTFELPSDVDPGAMAHFVSAFVEPKILLAGYHPTDPADGVYYKPLPACGPLKGCVLVLREASHPSVARLVAFRDRLRADPALVEAYNALKAAHATHAGLPAQGRTYAQAKRDFAAAAVSRRDPP
jgi:GrpB-like predicted nucleotidyltransferase (UPF0157 family)